MKRIRLKLAVLALVSSAVSSFAGGVETVSLGEALAGRNCAFCHGPSVQGFATAPRLAGQQAAYVENQLRSFHDHSRDNPLSQQYMWGAAAKLDAETARELAAYFAALEPEPAGDGNPDLADIGRKLYNEGNPEGNIVPCTACHGPNAEGIRNIPRLGGLSHAYLKRRLAQWGEGYHQSASAPMPGIARKLSGEQIAALASYLSFVK
jgi:cytochrome c553